MAKKQTRRSISVSRTTYEKLKSFCETNGISMSQFVETRVGDFLGDAGPSENSDATPRPVAPRPMAASPSRPMQSPAGPRAVSTSVSTSVSSSGPRPQVTPAATPAPSGARPAAPAPMTSAAARYAVEPPPPIIKRSEQPAPKAPAMPKANEIFTF